MLGRQSPKVVQVIPVYGIIRPLKFMVMVFARLRKLNIYMVSK